MALGQRSPPTQRLLGFTQAVEARAAEVKETDMHSLGVFWCVFVLAFLASYSVQDCCPTPQVFANESLLSHMHRSGFTGGKVKWKGKCRREHQLEHSE